MTFSSLAFLFIFFPIVFILYSVCANTVLRNALLIISSLVFYAYGEPVAVFIMLISVILNYLLGLVCAEAICGEFLSNHEKLNCVIKKISLVLAVVTNIGLLFVFKYADFFLDVAGLKEYKLNIALPIGISFFTFQGLSYVIDVYRDKECVQKNLFSVMLYISFFPQLIAGPIVKYHDIKEQLAHREFNIDRIGSGIQRFIFGLSKKVIIAGPMGLMADSIYALPVAEIGRVSAWFAAISYMLQIYFDFSGYSDMAIGLGCIFGFDFKENFNKPYAAVNMQHFWRRWHISLSTWFKEYVYIPLGGNRKGTMRTYINKFIVFMLTGLWHGANWTFVCWGILHGLALIIEDMVKRVTSHGKQVESKVLSGVLWIAGHVYTLVFVTLTFVVFRADNLRYAVGMIGRMFVGDSNNAIAFSLLNPMYIVAFVMAVIFSSTIMDSVIAKTKSWILKLVSIALYVICIAMLITGGYNPFIYFRF